MESDVVDLICEKEVSVFVVDCLPNMNASMVTEKCVPLVKQIRAKKPNVPIILVEDRRNTNSWIIRSRQRHHDANHAALTAAYEALKSESVGNLHYISGDALYGTDGEGATDGSHANDLGFMRQADVFEPVLRKAMGLE